MKKKEIIFRLGELFCGPGGIASGAAKASVNAGHKRYSISHAWATDFHEDSCETYRTNIFPNNPERVVHKDIRELDFKILKKISKIDALAFGFPCNDFSMVGEQKGVNGEYGPLYTFGAKALSFFEPKWFLAENVGGLKSSNNGKAFVSILKAFRDCGYKLYPHLYKFEEYGIPQTRHRIIIIGIHKNLDVQFRVPAPAYITKTAGEALSDIPSDAPNQERTRQSETVIARLTLIKPGQNAFTANLPKSLQLNVRGARISQIYKRLDSEKPAYTVTGSGGGGTHIYHWKEPRALTNRERARLQTFDDDFFFCGSKESVRRQIGMAVPVEGVRQIFDAVLKSFAGVEYDFVPPSFETLGIATPDSEQEAERLRLLEKEATKYGKDIQ